MECTNCGEQLHENAKFCSACGKAVSDNNFENNSGPEQNCNPVPVNTGGASVGEKIKTKIHTIWERLAIFYKVCLIALLVITVLFFVANCAGKTFAIACSVVQFVCVAVSMLLRKGIIKTDKKWLPYLVLAIAILLSILNVNSYFWNRISADTDHLNNMVNDYQSIIAEPERENESSTTKPAATISTTVCLPFGHGECIGRKQEEIVEALELAGFINISSMPIPELEASEMERKGEICSITVDGQEAFCKGDEVDQTAVIEITYYEAKKITAPITPKEAETIETEALVNLFKEAGFLDVSVEIKEDIDPEYSQEEFRNEVSINFDSSFDSADVFAIDSQVTITSHRPIEKYKIIIRIDFIPNFFFDKYSVDVEIGDKDLGTLSHGEDNTYEIWLKPGQHTITFKKHSYIKPQTECKFTIRGETEITYQISCYEDSIHVEQIEFIYKGAIGANEAMTPASAQEFKHDNYRDVENSLKNAGFTNIKTVILYDIVWGWTSEGEVDSVSIDGNDEFLKGAIFNKAAEVIITYHMLAEDDPSRITVTKDASEYEGLDYTYVEREFIELGFTNIIYDDEVTTNTCYHTGEVVKVRINYSEFEAGDSFSPNAEIKITRYKVDSTDEKPSITVTMSGDDLVGLHYSEAEAKVQEMGFTNIVYQERITHDPDIDPETIDYVTIDSRYSFRVGEMFDNDAEVILVYWKYEEYHSDYEIAFVRRMQEYSLYYMFDTDTNQVAYFSTDDTSIDYGTYWGDFSTGVIIRWNHGQWTEMFTYSGNGNAATLVDGNGFEWEYVKTDLINAQKQMDDLN